MSDPRDAVVEAARAILKEFDEGVRDARAVAAMARAEAELIQIDAKSAHAGMARLRRALAALEAPLQQDGSPRGHGGGCRCDECRTYRRS